MKKISNVKKYILLLIAIIVYSISLIIKNRGLAIFSFVILLIEYLVLSLINKRKFKLNYDLILTVISILLFIEGERNTANNIMLINFLMIISNEVIRYFIFNRMLDFVKDDKNKVFINEDGSKEIRLFSSLKKGDVIQFKEGETVLINGEDIKNNKAYFIGDTPSRKVLIRSDEDYKDLVDKDIIKAYKKNINNIISKDYKFYYLMTSLVILIIYFMLLASGYKLEEASYYSLSLLFLIIPIIFTSAYDLLVATHLACLQRERIELSEKDFIDLSKVDTFLIDKSTIVMERNLRVVSKKSNYKGDILLLLKTLEQNINDEIGDFFERYPGDYLFDIDSYKSYDGGRKVFVGKDVYYIGNAKFFRNLKLDYEKNKTLGTVIYLSKNKEFLGSVVLRSDVHESVKDLINYLQSKNKEVVLLSGDNEEYVKSIVKSLGITRYMTEVNKDEKLSFLKLSKESGEKVLFLGESKYDKKLFEEAYMSIEVGDNRKTKSNIKINHYDYKDFLRLFKARDHFRKILIFNYVLVVLSLILRSLLVVKTSLSLELSLICLFLTLLLNFILSLEIMYKK